MMGRPRYPSLYQINARVWLHELGGAPGGPEEQGQFTKEGEGT
jgi:hypothetical protein